MLVSLPSEEHEAIVKDLTDVLVDVKAQRDAAVKAHRDANAAREESELRCRDVMTSCRNVKLELDAARAHLAECFEKVRTKLPGA